MHYLTPLPSFLLLAAIAVLASPAARADSLLVTEVVTDPQGDHSESAGGNGVPYDAFPGTGTVSSVDEFIEVFHAGTVPVDLAGFVLEFLDATPSTYVFGITTSGVLRFSPGSSLHAFAPGGFVVLGNPPGSLNNTIEVLLRAPDGTLLDRLAVADGNATAAFDEAVVRLWTGTAFLRENAHDAISPLAPGRTVPEPAPWTLALLSASTAALATLRRERPGRGRTTA